MSRHGTRVVSVLAMPGNRCWTVYIPELDQGAVVEGRAEIEPMAWDCVSSSVRCGEIDDLSQDDLDKVRLEIEILPPLTTYPIPMKWLSQAADYKINPALGRAYCWPDYPGQRTGEGRWVDLYWGEERQFSVGRLWTDDNTGCGLLFCDDMDSIEYTVAALLIRHLYRTGVLANLAFELLCSLYPTGAVQVGRLSGIADLDIEHNEKFLNGSFTPPGASS